MEQMNINIRVILAFVFAFAAVVIIAMLQLALHFNTYVAMVICLIVACIFFWIINKGE